MFASGGVDPGTAKHASLARIARQPHHPAAPAFGDARTVVANSERDVTGLFA
jgi:hypothetical protein